MFHSLRFRLPALFLVGLTLAGIVSTAIAFRLFQDYTRHQSIVELRKEARGIATLFSQTAGDVKRTSPSTKFAKEILEQATGDKLLYAGAPVFPEQARALPLLGEHLIPGYKRVLEGHTVTFEFVPRGQDRTYLAAAAPVRLPGGPVFGALVAATPKNDLSTQVEKLIGRLAIAFLVGVLVAIALAWFISRWVTRPLQALSQAADQVALRRYDADIPDIRRKDEVGHLADRFRDMTTQLRESSELERNFLMTVSHELRTPLTAIRGHVAALQEGIADDPDARALSLGAIASETERLGRLVGDILDLAKLESNRFTMRSEEIDMERLIDRAYTAFDREARRRQIDYERHVEAKATIVSDGDRVLQIITNLLSNAFKWTPDGGRVELGLAQENGSVSVAVEDSGPGIDAAERERIFRPFWTGDGRGTGLGLAISRELALALGGRIELKSDPGQGSRFELVLPVA
jgi:signal transduction histidine kinase